MNRNHSNIILFDGVCNLCNNIVNFIITRDRKGKFLFAPLQSREGQKLLKAHCLSTKDFDSFVFIKDGVYYLKSTAGLMVLKELGCPWNVFYGFIVIPRPVRDLLYDFIARIRYRIFGKRKTCMVPNPAYKNRFLH